MASTLQVLSLKPVTVRASWDTQQRLPYNPQRTYPKIPQNPKTLISTTITPSVSLVANVNSLVPVPVQSTNPKPKQVKLEEPYFPVPSLVQSANQKPRQVNLEETNPGHGPNGTWLPSPPNVEKPRSIYNATTLAYLGDCIYELYARRHFLFPPLNIEDYNDRVMAVVRCEAQDALLRKLLKDRFLSEEECDVLRWGKNVASAKTRAKKRAGVAVYSRASSLETLVGFLYLTNMERLDEIMLQLGFSSGASTELIS